MLQILCFYALFLPPNYTVVHLSLEVPPPSTNGSFLNHIQIAGCFTFKTLNIEPTPKSHPMNIFTKCSAIYNLVISQLEIHRMT